MAYAARFHPDDRLVVVVFDGEITAAEEMQAFVATVTDPRMFPDACFLIDKRAARMTVGPEDVEPQIDVVEEHGPALGRARVAHVVSRDYDFGMLRMMEMKSDDKVPHDFRVFRSVEEACAWLGVDPELAEDFDR